jgi:hypothetical protein
MSHIRVTCGVVSGSLLAFGLAAVVPALANPACTTGTGMEICVTYDSSVTSLTNASTVEAAFNSVAQRFSNAITNNTSGAPVAIDVKFGPVTAGNVSTSVTSTYNFGSFSHVVAAVQPATSALGYSLPASDPAGGALWFMPQAQAKALGLTLPLNTGAFDGTISFSSAAAFGYTRP